MKNNLADVNNHLFEMLEKLGDDDVVNDKEKLNAELQRAKAMVDVSQTILSVASVQVSALRVAEECGYKQEELPALITIKDSKQILQIEGKK